MEHSKSFDTLQYYSKNYGIGDDVHVDDICGLTIGPVKDMGLDFELQDKCQTIRYRGITMARSFRSDTTLHLYPIE